MPVIIKALSMALHHYPILNAVVNPECTTITEKADHNIGVAMDTAEGLVVPNVKQVQVGLDNLILAHTVYRKLAFLSELTYIPA